MTLLSEAKRAYADLAKMDYDLHLFPWEQDLVNRLQVLQRDQRTVLSLLYVEGLNCEQVAKVMRISVEDTHLLRDLAVKGLSALPIPTITSESEPS